MTPADRVADVRRRMRDAARRVGRDDGSVRLVAVVKGRSVDEARALFDAGALDLAENRVDALLEKQDALPSARWHFIGNVQRNKLKHLAKAAPLVHSFDRPDLAGAWPPEVRVLVQVHLGGGAHRNGLPPSEVPGALARMDRHGMRCEGLSLLPPAGEDPRPHFRDLCALRDELAASWPEVRELSMGMTDDFEVAVEEGATLVRVGRGLFT